ncbi:hypothetical protein MMU07_20805 [Aquiflexum sp. LQ15W]|uniref:hypothetical protein n=1 Tax=Cognataquiflexum nitidum TaxID=2922272 RepID=UPI001F136BBD|nr:hypothetical protein [Cognataquiflexum nitidum]MCH6202029.1 hypothetical protein [Cognataquiflexum nitidum]
MIPHLMRFVTEIPNSSYSLPWAAVHEDYSGHKNQCSTLPMATQISLRRGGLFFLIKGPNEGIPESSSLVKKSHGTPAGRKSADRAGGGLERG